MKIIKIRLKQPWTKAQIPGKMARLGIFLDDCSKVKRVQYGWWKLDWCGDWHAAYADSTLLLQHVYKSIYEEQINAFCEAVAWVFGGEVLKDDVEPSASMKKSLDVSSHVNAAVIELEREVAEMTARLKSRKVTKPNIEDAEIPSSFDEISALMKKSIDERDRVNAEIAAFEKEVTEKIAKLKDAIAVRKVTYA